jgi:hypothetical protein
MAICTYSQPTCRVALAGGVGDALVVVAAMVGGDPLAVAVVDASELLDVDVDQLAWVLTLVAHSGLQAQPPELAHPDPREDR